MAATEQTRGIPYNALFGVAPRFPDQELTDSGAITLLAGGVVVLNKAGVIAATLAAPAQDGVVLLIGSITAQAHTVTVTGGLGGLGAGSDVGTFGAAIGNGCILFSKGGYWVQAVGLNVTWA